MGSTWEGTGNRYQVSDGVGQEEKTEGGVSCVCFCVVLSATQAAFGFWNDIKNREMVK